MRRFLVGEIDPDKSIEGIMINLRSKYEELVKIEEKIQNETEAEQLNKEISSFDKYSAKYEEAIVLSMD